MRLIICFAPVLEIAIKMAETEMTSRTIADRVPMIAATALAAKAEHFGQRSR
jgi:hypothetical protein